MGKYLIKNKCYCEECLYNYHRRCFCRKDELKRGLNNKCMSYKLKFGATQAYVNEFLLDEEIEVPLKLLKEPTGVGSKRLRDMMVLARVEKLYKTRTLFSYPVSPFSQKRVYTDVSNLDIINFFLQKREVDWQEERKVYQESLWKD